jgi:antitoxin VapB
MALQIANPAVVAKIERLAKATGLTKTAAVERAVEALLQQEPPNQTEDIRRNMRAILAQIDRTPDLPAPSDPLQWDAHGLPR